MPSRRSISSQTRPSQLTCTFCKSCEQFTVSSVKRYRALIREKGCPVCHAARPMMFVGETVEELEKAILSDGRLIAQDAAVNQQRFWRGVDRFNDREEELIRSGRRPCPPEHPSAKQRRKRDEERENALAEGRAVLLGRDTLEKARLLASGSRHPRRLEIPCPSCGRRRRTGWTGYGGAKRCRGCHKLWFVERLAPSKPLADPDACREGSGSVESGSRNGIPVQ